VGVSNIYVEQEVDREKPSTNAKPHTNVQKKPCIKFEKNLLGIKFPQLIVIVPHICVPRHQQDEDLIFRGNCRTQCGFFAKLWLDSHHDDFLIAHCNTG